MISEYVSEFAGKPVRDFSPETGLDDPTGVAWRLRVDYEDERQWTDLMQALLADPNAGQVESLVIGAWGNELYEGGEDASIAVNALVAGAKSLGGLRHLFLGDITSEESEISWIPQTDVSPLWAAFPQLEQFRVRGAEGLSLGQLRHENLRTLIVESGGLPRGVVKQICEADLPRLEHLEIWLGEANYGGDVTPADLQPILSGELFPNLTYLGLCDSAIADEVAAAVAEAPVLEKIDVLDLSKGALSDKARKPCWTFP